MMGLPLEEIDIGWRVELGSHAFTRDNVLAFARKYDPQPFHVDDEAAARGPFGKLAASGWHTAAAWMKCYIATNQAAEAARRAAGLPVYETRPSPGFDNLKWLKPVFPGDTISYRATVTAKRELVPRPGLGLLFSVNEGVNQAGELVFSFDGKVLSLKR
jgi:acyl dehydratase